MNQRPNRPEKKAKPPEATPQVEAPEGAEVIHIDSITVDAFVRTLKQADREGIAIGFVHEEKLKKTRRLPLAEWTNEYEKFKRVAR